MSGLKEKYKKYVNKKTNYKAWYTFFYGFFFLLGKTLFPGKALGLEHLPQSGGYVLAFNHRSWKDVPLSFYAIPGYRHFVGKEEHYNNAFARFLFPKMGAIAVDRENIDLSTIRRVASVLKKAKCSVFSPRARVTATRTATCCSSKTARRSLQCRHVFPSFPSIYIRNRGSSAAITCI